MKKPAIPAIGISTPQRDILEPMKESIEILTGQRGEKLRLLSEDATLPEVIARLNKVIRLLQNVE
jgi:hypothetical protein